MALKSYMDQLLVTDPELTVPLDASMNKLGYARTDFSALGPELDEAFNYRDKPFRSEFRSKDERVLYTKNGHVVQVRRAGTDHSGYWHNRWGALVIYAVDLPDTENFSNEEAGELMIGGELLQAVVRSKRLQLPGIDFRVVNYPIVCPSWADPCDQYPVLGGGKLFVNQQIIVSRQLDTNIEGPERGKVVKVLSGVLPYSTETIVRSATVGATKVKAVRDAEKAFKKELAFLNGE